MDKQTRTLRAVKGREATGERGDVLVKRDLTFNLFPSV